MPIIAVRPSNAKVYTPLTYTIAQKVRKDLKTPIGCFSLLRNLRWGYLEIQTQTKEAQDDDFAETFH